MSRAVMQQALEALEMSHPRYVGQSDRLYMEEDRNHRAAIAALREELAKPKPVPVAKVLFRQDVDGLEPINFYGPGTAPDPSTIKDRFTLRDVWLSPPQRQPLTDAGLAKPELMRMPKIDDRVVFIEGGIEGTVRLISPAGGPFIKFDDGTDGQWSLYEFGEMFHYQGKE